MTKSDASKNHGIIYTFYSYKGGVGRSMALVNIGVLMALEGKRVLLVDWDLEAPGLEVFFEKAAVLKGDPRSVPGIVDMLEARRENQALRWQECCLQAEFLGVSLDIISAGSKTPDYRKRVQQLDWEVLYRDHTIGNFINDLREDWRAPGHYDFVLVDSRTGITDIGDICTVLLPDAVVFMFVTNYQNIEGVKGAMDRAAKAHSSLPVNRPKLLRVPLLGRDELYSEYEQSEQWKKIIAEDFSAYYREWLPREVTPADALAKLFIPYVTNWSFGERIPVLENSREMKDPTTIGAAFKRVSGLLINRLDWYKLDTAISVAELQGANWMVLHERERLEQIKKEQALREEEIRAELQQELKHQLAQEKERALKQRQIYLIFTTVLLFTFLVGALTFAWPRLRPQDPLTALTQMGWTISTERTGERLVPTIGLSISPERGDDRLVSRISSPSSAERGGGRRFYFNGNPPFLKSKPFLSQLRARSIFIDNVTNLQGIEAWQDLTDLSQLHASGRFTNVTPLRALRNLTSLNIDGSSVADLTPLSGIMTLQSLSLSFTFVVDLGPLSSLTNLSALSLSGTRTHDLSPLSRLSRLSELDLSGSEIVDLSPLIRLPGLLTLDLSGTRVTDLRPLLNLDSLSFLDLSGTLIKDLTPLAKARRLERLTIADTQVSSAIQLSDETLNELRHGNTRLIVTF